MSCHEGRPRFWGIRGIPRFGSVPEIGIFWPEFGMRAGNISTVSWSEGIRVSGFGGIFLQL